MTNIISTMLHYFALPWALPLVVLLPLATVWMIRQARSVRGRRLAHLGTSEMIARLAPPSPAASGWQPIRLGVAALLVAIAFAGPRWGVERTVVRQAGIDVVLALDASSSMLARDETPDRLSAMKSVVARLRALSPNDRFALVAFAGRSYVLSPVTVDDAALDLFIRNLDPTVVGQSGSSIAGAIRQSTNLLSISESEAERAIVLMSDGEGFEEESAVVDEAKRAAGLGITVITAGFGTAAGANIPVRVNGVPGVKRDQAGVVVTTRYSPDLLRAAAAAGRGVFVAPTDPGRAATIRQSLARLRTEQRSISRGGNLAQRFQFFLAPALLLLLLDTFITARRGRRRGLAAIGTAAAGVLALMVAGCAGDEVQDRAAAELYNRGTAMVVTRDSLLPAIPILKSAGAKTKVAEVQFRAGFNAGFGHLRHGLAMRGDTADTPLDSALAVYRRVLLARGDDRDAKWNYELALRQNRSGGGGGGGGGGGNSQPQPEPTASGAPTPRPRPIPGMTAQRAEQILDAMEQEEQDVQGRKQRRSVPMPPPNGRDW